MYLHHFKSLVQTFLPVLKNIFKLVAWERTQQLILINLLNADNVDKWIYHFDPGLYYTLVYDQIPAKLVTFASSGYMQLTKNCSENYVESCLLN